MKDIRNTRNHDILYPVAEYFVSINGEGPASGYLAAFIRLRGCNLHCSYCDTRWACLDDCPVTLMTGRDLLDRILEDGITRATITGGEPLLTEGMEALVDLLGKEGISVEIESNGSMPILPYCSLDHRPAFTLDYKCPGSGMEEYMLTENFQHLQPQDSVKFVVCDQEDLLRAEEIIRTFDLSGRCNLFLSPVFGKIQPSDIVDFMKSHRWNTLRLQLQMHKFIWPPDMRGV